MEIADYIKFVISDWFIWSVVRWNDNHYKESDLKNSVPFSPKKPRNSYLQTEKFYHYTW